ncbi:hypothetical protein IWT25_02533 [Secundilactobacillus pentosiphilus]|uniref:Uncharacterized protein n=1 Tax=Secundilactobacillus pentosiphilus TaxID=1714682 RepID=A0A1Z5IZH8_9LACO|nr:hypothetical protein [Secundilactobacillus pentosiphilus]GAX07185.1 hypothetical protein IWT25_02533 [Secundilactobacillus pentosiphilus]
MKLRKSILLGATALTLGTGISTIRVSANHNFFYWEHPHWVTVTKKSTIYKIKNTNPLYKSYVVNKYQVYPGHHLLIHHAASFDWQVESGHFNSNGYYTYAVGRSSYSWFRSGIH